MQKIMKMLMDNLGHGGVTYDSQKGRLSLWTMPYFMIPMEVLSAFQKELIDTFGKEGYDVLYLIGRKHGFNATSVLLKKYGIKFEGQYKYFAEQTDLVGVGTLKLISITGGEHYVLQNHNSPLATAYKKKFSHANIPVDHYLRGMTAGVSEALDGRQLISIEKKCIARGDDYCEFQIFNNKTLKIENDTEKSQLPIPRPELDALLNKVEELRVIIQPASSLMRAIFKKKIINFRDGEFYVDNIPGLFTGMYVLVILDKYFLDRDKEKYEKILRKRGQMLGRYTYEKIGHPGHISPEIVNRELKQLHRYGFGNFNMLSAGGAKDTFFVENNFNDYAIFYKKIVGIAKEPVDTFLEGLLEGFISKLFGKECSVKESECIAHGHSRCLFKVKLL